jgi:hypothetical protein
VAEMAAGARSAPKIEGHWAVGTWRQTIKFLPPSKIGIVKSLISFTEDLVVTQIGDLEPDAGLGSWEPITDKEFRAMLYVFPHESFQQSQFVSRVRLTIALDGKRRFKGTGTIDIFRASDKRESNPVDILQTSLEGVRLTILPQ